MKNPLSNLFASSIIAITALFTFAQAGVTYPEFADSAHIYGPKVSPKDLKKKVVFFEFWGINCPPCRASFPHLVELQSKYKDKGFVVIGSHAQLLSPKVKEFCEEQKVNFPIYQQIHIPGASLNSGLPCAFLINARGDIVAQGKPGDLYDKVEDLLKDCEAEVASILEGVTLNKYKKFEKYLSANTRNLDKFIEKQFRSKPDDEEAQAICASYDKWLESTKNDIAAKIETDPVGAVAAYSKFKVAVPSFKEYDNQIRLIKNNKDLKKLAVLKAKVTNMQDRINKGRRVPVTEVDLLVKEIDKMENSIMPGVSTTCADMKGILQDIRNQSETIKENRKKEREEARKKKQQGGGYNMNM